MAELKLVSVEDLIDHPLNPRIVYREDIVEAIVSGLGDEWEQEHALIVRPLGNQYQIISGHTRKRAAERKGLLKVWCWVKEMTDEEAYMLLATSNNQGELSPLEIGLHCFRCESLAKGGRGKKGGLSQYAERVGKGVSTISEYRSAAEVIEKNPSDIRRVLLDKVYHLAAIHALPQECWAGCVEWLAENPGTQVVNVQGKVKAANEFRVNHGIDKRWSGGYLVPCECAVAVFRGTRAGLFSTLSNLASQVLEDLSEHEDLAAKWVEWLEESEDSWDIAAVQAKRVELDTIRLEREEAPALETVSVLLADPPWKYDFAETSNRQIENQYPTADVDEICEHIHAPWVPGISDDAVLFLWATAPKLIEAMKVMEAWGFEYKTGAVWDKEKIGMGYWFRGQHELLLVGTRGKMSPPEPSARVSSVFREVRKEHSEKPDCVYSAIEAMFPTLSKFEMYQRKPRDGWEGGGLES